MHEPMILMGQNGNALVPFPCSIYTQKRTQEDNTTEYAIVAGDRIMAKFKDLAPAKMEIQRLVEVWKDRPVTKTCVFQFMKDVK